MDYLKKAKNSKTLGWRKGQRKQKQTKFNYVIVKTKDTCMQLKSKHF